MDLSKLTCDLNPEEFAKANADVVEDIAPWEGESEFDKPKVEPEPKAMVLNKHHGKIPKDAIYIGRGSPWGNNFVIGEHGTREEVIKMFAEQLDALIEMEPATVIPALAKLHGKQLVCYCAPKACHGDVLVKKALWAFNYLEEQKSKPVITHAQPEPVAAITKAAIIPKIAVIGTAGRDKTKRMTIELWRWMIQDAWHRLPKECELVSGGAAWADHIAVALYCMGRVQGLTLHLPAPFDMETCQFIGPYNSAASASNYYHGMFSQVLQENTLVHIAMAINKGAKVTMYPAAKGYAGFFNRNTAVSEDATGMLAYTFGPGAEPADGGTKDTWDKFPGEKIHVSLPQ